MYHLVSLSQRSLALSLMTASLAIAQSPTTEDQRLAASHPGEGDAFGQALAIEATLCVSGAPNDDRAASDGGSATVFRHDGTSWVEEQVLTASDARSGAFFGYSVALSGDCIVVGAMGDGDAAAGAGAAYVFRHDGSGWIEEAKLIAGDAQAWDSFGWSVACDGDRVAVGAWGDDDLASGAGSAYAFAFDGSQWQQEAKFLSTNPGDFDFFGWSVDLCGDTLVVGAYGEDSVLFNEGASYVYHHDGVSWSLQQKLVPAGALQSLDSGYDVAVSGDRLLVGTLGDGACLFRRSGAVWTEEAWLRGSDVAAFEGSGATVALDGELAAVSAIFHEVDGLADAGAGYVFRDTGQGWVEVQKMVSSTLDAGHFFGLDLALSGETVLAGAADTEGGLEGAGAVFSYELPALRLDIRPDAPALGDALSLDTTGGVDGNLGLMFVLELGGLPFRLKLFSGSFDADGRWSIAGAVPQNPNLSGLALGLASFSTDGSGRAVMSNLEPLSIQ